jgi:hypothetical protein
VSPVAGNILVGVVIFVLSAGIIGTVRAASKTRDTIKDNTSAIKSLADSMSEHRTEVVQYRAGVEARLQQLERAILTRRR